MRKVVTLGLCLLALVVQGQQENEKLHYWSFFLGLETQSLGIESLDSREPDEATVVPGRPGIGFTTGFHYQKKIWRGISFRPGISFSRSSNSVSFKQDGREKYYFNDLETPLHLIFTNAKSGFQPLRGQVILGARFGWNFAENATDRLAFLNERAAIDLGLGVSIHTGKFIICPEAVYSHGLNNLHDYSDRPYDYLVGRVVRDKLAFRVLISMKR